MKIKYDLVFGFGPACSCSQTLRRAGLQLLSFPFDWIGPGLKMPGWEGDVRRRADLVASRFDGWLQQEDFVHQGQHTNGMEIYWNTRLELVFVHDFPANVPLEDSYPKVAAKYVRRTARMLDLVEKSRNVLVVRLDRPDIDYRTPEDDCRYARDTLKRAFPTTEFDILLVQQDHDVATGSERLETMEPGFWKLRLDYLDTRAGADRTIPRLDLTSAAVSRFFAVREYRTKAEIAAYKDAEKRKRWAKYGATSAWQYRWRKLAANIRRSGKAGKDA